MFRFEIYGVIQSSMLVRKNTMGMANDGSDEHPSASEDQWKNMNFERLLEAAPLALGAEAVVDFVGV